MTGTMSRSTYGRPVETGRGMLERALCGEHGASLSLAPNDTLLLACSSYLARRIGAGMSVDEACDNGCLLYPDDLQIDGELTLVITDGRVFLAERDTDCADCREVYCTCTYQCTECGEAREGIPVGHEH